jgi:hypothetical protein
MRKKKSKVRFVESSFGQKIWSAFSIAHSIFHIASPYQNGAIVVCIFPTCHLWKCPYRAHVYWNLSHPLLSILKVIFLESNSLLFIKTLISFIRGFVYCLYIYAQLKIKLFVFVFNKQTTMAPFWYGDAMRMDKYLKRLRAFQRILYWNLRIYEHIWYENYDFMSQKWDKIIKSLFCWM